jgi:hypothetical protein
VVRSASSRCVGVVAREAVSGWLASGLVGVVLGPDSRSLGRMGVGWCGWCGGRGGHSQRWRVQEFVRCEGGGMGTIGLRCSAVPSTPISASECSDQCIGTSEQYATVADATIALAISKEYPP